MDSALLKRVLTALWDRQWTDDRFEQSICAHGCNYRSNGSSRTDDEPQIEHWSDCGFVELWGDLKTERQSVGFTEDFEGISQIKRRKA